ncbi:MAG: hypothetical protein J6V50_01485 [Clostridia bacterium]|nr:hypothetical protein [Clostridia bacterium]
MAHFKQNAKVKLCDPAKNRVVIDEFIGSGSQADIYKAHIESSKKLVAAKHCYFRFANNKNGFYNKVVELTKTPCPHPDLCWPEAVSRLAPDKSFVYTMPLVEGYKSLAGVINNTDNLSTGYKIVLLTKIALVLETLHSKGFVFGDISHNNILYKIEKDGNLSVKFIDCENISSKTEFYGLRGSERYQAPELLIPTFDGSFSPPTTYSDRFAFQVLAFRVLIRRHPLDGKLTRSVRIDNPEAYREFFGIRPKFIFDGSENAPDDNPKIAERWNALPEPIKDFFKISFSQKCLVSSPAARPPIKAFLNAALAAYRK